MEHCCFKDILMPLQPHQYRHENEIHQYITNSRNDKPMLNQSLLVVTDMVTSVRVSALFY